MDFEGRKISDLVNEAYETAVSKGWHDNPREFGTALALVHSEVTEAYKAENDNELVEELADVIIRIFNLCGEFGYDLDKGLVHVKKDFYEGNNTEINNDVLMEIHSKISDVLEIYRKGNLDDKEWEIAKSLAKVISYIVENCVSCNLPIAEAVLIKMKKNKDRPYRHGNKII